MRALRAKRAPGLSSCQSRAVEAFLLGNAPTEVDVGGLILAGVGAYGSSVIAKHPEVASAYPQEAIERLRREYVRSSARHAAIRRVIAKLLGAWREAGIEALLLKGFFLAEYVYDDASWRPYSDVDLAIRSEELSGSDLAQAAAHVATEAGWFVTWRLGEPPRADSLHELSYNGHELMGLYHAALGLSVDVHRRLVHSNARRSFSVRKQERLTDAVWLDAGVAQLEGVEVSVPSPVDAVLIGVITARSWSQDALAIRPSDFLDLKFLFQYGRLTSADVLARSRELRIPRTAGHFLRKCNPETGKLELVAPNALRLFFYDLAIMPERSHRSLERLWWNLVAVPTDLVDIAREVPMVTVSVARARLGWSPFNSGIEVGRRPLDRDTWRRTTFAVRRALQLNGVWPASRPDLALACMYNSLTMRGIAVALKQRGGRLWIEAEGVVPDHSFLGLADRATKRVISRGLAERSEG